jgi:hypothetical protein
VKGRTTTYVWRLAPNAAAKSFDDRLYSSLTGVLFRSGVPITFFIAGNDKICLEVDKAYEKDPRAIFEQFGVHVAADISQEKIEGKSCGQLFPEWIER